MQSYPIKLGSNIHSLLQVSTNLPHRAQIDDLCVAAIPVHQSTHPKSKVQPNIFIFKYPSKQRFFWHTSRNLWSYHGSGGHRFKITNCSSKGEVKSSSSDNSSTPAQMTAIIRKY